MLEDITRRFNLAIEEKFKDKLDVKNFILKHERKHLCIQNLKEQIVIANNYSISIRVEIYASVIRDVALMFASACLLKVEEDHYSSIKRSQINAKQDALKEAEGLLKDLEKDAINDTKLTEIERDEIKEAIRQTRAANKVQA